MTHRFLFVVFLCVLAESGCIRPAPEGLPPLVSAKVCIVDGQKPLVGVRVSLLRKEGHGGWSLGGTTDPFGNAVMGTVFGRFESDGIPAGNYRVLLGERIALPPELSPSEDEQLKMSADELKTLGRKKERYISEHRMLSPAFSEPDNTPFEWTVPESGGALEIDISKYR